MSVEWRIVRLTCSVQGVIYWDTWDRYEYTMACGGRFDWADTEPPEFCPCCGGRVPPEPS